MYTLEQYRESADSIRERLGGRQPEILMILGTGLGGLGDKIKKPVHIPYGDIPNFKTATAIGHIGRFVSGELGGRQVLVMQGRLHVYEGYTMEDVAYPIRVAKLLGIDKLVITNNAGGINKSFCPGDLMIITDYIKFAPGSPPQRVSSGPFPGVEPHVFCKVKPVKLKKVAFSHFFDTL